MEPTSDKQANTTDQNSEEIKGIWKDILVFLKKILDIRSDTDKKGTIQDIKDNISMQGHTAWVLVFSILIASIGLNVSSAAVVIGAMLISPLMGPILGVGLSIGINDIETLKRSFINLGVMIGLSLVTSFLFFKIPTFQELTPEIRARIAPDVRDVFIAISGGLALILAISRRSKQTNTIAGVAIATALMPPLCVAGYGLAVWDMHYFVGAMFLFTINAIFIALATFLIVKFLRFPMVKYINSAKRKRVAQIATFVAILIFGFSVFEFVKLYQKNQFESKISKLTKEMSRNNVHVFDLDSDNYNYESGVITLETYTNVPDDQILEWKKRATELGLNGDLLEIKDGSQSEDLIKRVDELTLLYSRNQEIISSNLKRISEEQIKVDSLERELAKYSEFPFIQVSKEARIIYSGLETLSYSTMVTTDFTSVDTLYVFNASWYDSIPNTEAQEKNLGLWLKTRLSIDTLQVKRSK